MDKKQYKCPHCGDTWDYKMVIDHETNKCIMTNDYNFVEDGQVCNCFKCHEDYTMKITSPSDVKMADFIYKVWKNCKM